jgi:hypothetical protein
VDPHDERQRTLAALGDVKIQMLSSMAFGHVGKIPVGPDVGSKTRWLGGQRLFPPEGYACEKQ